MTHKISRLLMTLVALFAMTTGAWADDWTNIVKNSDMEGTDVSCFYVKENAKGAANIYLARITAGIGKDGSRAIKVKTDCNEVNNYDTQFFIRLPYELPAGTKYKISFDYKASNGDNDITAFQCANEPGEYIIWYIDETKRGATGFYFTTDWQHFSQQYTIPDACNGTQNDGGYMNNCQTFALNLGKFNSEVTEYIFDNIKVEILSSVLAGLTPQPVTNPDFMKLYVTSNATNEWDFDMLAGNVELQVDYFAESNLFLHKEALADMANIAVKNGETAVEFDAEGKSTAIVTEDDKVTVQFAGTKKVLGMKAMEKAVAATVADEGTTIRPISEALVSSNFCNSGWGSDSQSYAEWDANAKKVTVHIKEDKAARWQGWVQVQMESAPRKGYSYQLKAKMKNLGQSSAIQNVCVKYPEGDEGDTPMIQREDISLPANQEYVFESGLLAGIDGKTANIVFDFGYAKAGDDIEIYDIEVTETYTGLEVNWDAATKTGTFTMAAYDVEIAPIYAPAAKWATEGEAALAPTAVEGIKAGASDAIVEAGTVAKTGDILQGTAMYAVGTSATEVPALTAFSDALPTAAAYDDAQTVYVWYYIKGADTPEGQEATAENTFNDSEICATPLTVSVLTNKFYIAFEALTANTIEDGKATVKVDGTDKTADITDSKLTGLSKGQTVTLTAKQGYKFRKVEAKKAGAGPATVDLDASTKAWTDGMALAVPAGGLTYGDAVTVSGNVTLTLTAGTTLTLNKGISLAEGATLTIDGTGTMAINGSNGSTASTVAGTGTLVLTSGTLTAKGGDGGGTSNWGMNEYASAGGVAINAAVTVNGGTLTATGGNGGNVAEGGTDCHAGNGGAAISGALTINGGTVTRNNGSNGSVGEGCTGCGAGAGSKAVAGTVTDNRN